MNAITIDLEPVESEVLQPSEFLRLIRENPTLIKSSEPLLPQLGERGFGSFRVTYAYPIFKHRAEHVR